MLPVPELFVFLIFARLLDQGPSPAGEFYNNESWAGEVWTDDPALGPQGDMRIVFTPAQCLETWQEAINPTDAVAGLMSVTDAVLNQLPKSLVSRSISREDMAMVRALSATVPALPVAQNATTRGHSEFSLTPAEYWSRNGNDENTELYAVHPFQLASVNRTALGANASTGGLTPLGVAEGRETYFRRRYPKNLGETADIMQGKNTSNPPVAC